MTSTSWPPQPIKLLMLDVDGTLTDGGVYFDAEGPAMKRFDVHDGLGLVRLREAGVEVALVTADSSPIAQARAAKLGIRAVFAGCRNKAEVVRRLLEERGLKPDEALYMGDDVSDLGAMAEVGNSAAPASAMAEVREAADYVTTKTGGHGAVREVCDLILARLAGD